jgi:hypothetical protein
LADANHKLFALLLRDLLKSPEVEWSHPALRLLAAPTDHEQAIFNDVRAESNWSPRKRLVVALFHFVFWSSFIDLYADWTYRIEETSAAAVCARVEGLGSFCKDIGSVPGKAISKSTNSHDIISDLEGTTWHSLCDLAPNMTWRAQMLGERYGYPIDSGGLVGCY